MSILRPCFSFTGDSVPTPSLPFISTTCVFGPGPSSILEALLLIRGVNIDHASGRAVCPRTDTIDVSTGADVSINSGTSYWPLMIGWNRVTYDGKKFSYVYSEQDFYPGTTVHFDADDNTGKPPPISWTADIRAWRKV